MDITDGAPPCFSKLSAQSVPAGSGRPPKGTVGFVGTAQRASVPRNDACDKGPSRENRCFQDSDGLRFMTGSTSRLNGPSDIDLLLQARIVGNRTYALDPRRGEGGQMLSTHLQLQAGLLVERMRIFPAGDQIFTSIIVGADVVIRMPDGGRTTIGNKTSRVAPISKRRPGHQPRRGKAVRL